MVLLRHFGKNSCEENEMNIVDHVDTFLWTVNEYPKFFLGVATVLLGVGYQSLAPLDASEEMKRAESSVQEINDRETEFIQIRTQATTKLDEFIEQIRPGSITADLKTVKELEAFVAETIELGNSLLEVHSEWVSSADEYKDALAEVVPKFRRLQAKFERYASDKTGEDYEQIRQMYASVASIYGSWASRFEQTQADMSPTLQSIDDSMEFTKETIVFLERLQASLKVFQPLEKSGLLLEELIAGIQEYAKRFESIRASLNRLDQRLKAIEKTSSSEDKVKVTRAPQ